MKRITSEGPLACTSTSWTADGSIHSTWQKQHHNQNNIWPCFVYSIIEQKTDTWVTMKCKVIFKHNFLHCHYPPRLVCIQMSTLYCLKTSQAHNKWITLVLRSVTSVRPRVKLCFLPIFSQTFVTLWLPLSPATTDQQTLKMLSLQQWRGGKMWRETIKLRLAWSLLFILGGKFSAAVNHFAVEHDLQKIFKSFTCLTAPSVLRNNGPPSN